MRTHRVLAGAAAAVLAATAAWAQQPAERAREPERLLVFVANAGIGMSAGPRGRGSQCDITGIVRALCAGPNGAPTDSCEITDGQIGAASSNLFAGTPRTDILQSCGIASLESVRAFGVTYVCRGALTSQTVGQVVRHERPVAFGPSNEPKQRPPWRIILACR